MLQQSKHFLKSKGVWANIFSLISFIILFFVSKSVMDKSVALTGAFTAIGGIWGRIVAKEKLSFTKKSRSKNVKKKH